MNTLTLNSYNTYAKDFFADSDTKKVHKYIEKPAMYENLPDITGKKVLCIGCGTGEECLEMYKRGALEIIGVDASYAMLEIAKSKYSYIPNIRFVLSNFLELSDDFGTFDFIYSSLTLHYEENLSECLKKLNFLLTPSGTLLFSLSHPIRSAFQELSIGKSFIRGIGVAQNTSPENETPFGDYFDNSLKEETWMQGKFNYNYYHFTFEQIFNAHFENHLAINKLIEPTPLKEAVDLPLKYKKYPTILIIRSSKEK